MYIWWLPTRYITAQINTRLLHDISKMSPHELTQFHCPDPKLIGLADVQNVGCSPLHPDPRWTRARKDTTWCTQIRGLPCSSPVQVRCALCTPKPMTTILRCLSSVLCLLPEDFSRSQFLSPSGERRKGPRTPEGGLANYIRILYYHLFSQCWVLNFVDTL